MATEPETAAEGYRRRRRSRRASRTGNNESWNTRFRRAWRRWLTPVMLGVTALWGAGTYLRTYQDAQMLGYFASDMRPADTLYAMGKPGEKVLHHGRERWLYRSGSQVMALDFAPSGQLLNVLCTSTVLAPSDCPRAQGIRLGMTEDQIWYVLGAPPVEVYEGTNKIIAYPAIGLTVRLRQFRASAIAVQPRKAFFGVIPTVLRKLVP